MKVRSRFSTIITISTLTLLCIGVILVSWMLFKMPAIVSNTFGHPFANLNPLEEFRLSLSLYWHTDALTHPIDSQDLSVPFRIELGESTGSIIHRLWDSNLISNPEAVRDYMVYSGADLKIQAGEYRISKTLSSIEIIGLIQDSSTNLVLFSILPGWRAEQIANSFQTSGLSIKEDEFIRIVHDLDAEGFLMPGLYEIRRRVSVHEFVQTFLDSFDKKVSIEIRDKIIQHGITLREAVTLASIIEREAVLETEMPLIASVFLNRLANGMKLEADSTVQYALGFNQTQNSWWTNPLSLTDLKFDSPYNTYLYFYLPPGPISNPSFNALYSVAYSAVSSNFYFRAACDGSGKHVFSETFEEHVSKSCP